MRKVILDLAVTLDGFIEGPNGEVDWCRTNSPAGNDSGASSHFDKLFSEIDAIFFGRVSYEAWGEYQPAKDASPFEKNLWSGVHSKTKYVFSRTPNPTSAATFITHDIATRVNAIKNQPGKNIWLYGGSDLITTFINLDLIDRYLLAVYPVILGGGKRLFNSIENRVGLELIKTTSSDGGVVVLEYGRGKSKSGEV